MGRVLVAASAFACATLIATANASADDMPTNDGLMDDVPETSEEFARLVHETNRVPPFAPEADTDRFFMHGEYQLRYQAERSFPLDATASAIAGASRPGLREQSIGQSQFVHHWLRLNPILQVKQNLEVVSQFDVVTGLVVGDTAHDTSADATPRDSRNGFSNVQPRWIYVQYKLPFGVIRVGQQPNHWGMGLVANDGDHPVTFGDYRYGSISERLLLAIKPASSDVHLALAGDLIFRDNFARLTAGQQAFQGVLVAAWERNVDTVGVYSTLRHQENDHASSAPLLGYSDDLDLVTIDVHGRIAKRIPGDENAYVFAEAEAAYELGSTTMLRTAAQGSAGATTQVRAYGGAAAVGVIHRAWTDKSEGKKPFGDVVGQVEIGYASGDADPYDSTERRFTFDPNHRVGLLLFDEIMRFQTARSATAIADPLLGQNRAAFLASNGGVFGAQYINPTVVIRPRRWLDLSGGMVIAQATSDVVDPYRLETTGSYVNYRGADPRRKDLGLELDTGAEVLIPLANDAGLNAGVQAGMLFPGSALDMDVQWIAVGRVGASF